MSTAIAIGMLAIITVTLFAGLVAQLVLSAQAIERARR